MLREATRLGSACPAYCDAIAQAVRGHGVDAALAQLEAAVTARRA